MNHVVVVPFPGRGHINPMMNLCLSLSSKLPEAIITFILTEEWLGFIGSDSKPSNIRLVAIPNVLPSELIRGSDTVGFFDAVQTKMVKPVDELIDRLEVAVDLIIGDAILGWPVGIAQRRNIQVASFWPMSASILSVFYHFDLLVQHQHFPVDVSEKGEEMVDYIPGLSPMKISDLPAIFFEKDRNPAQMASVGISTILKSQYLIISTTYELEQEAIKVLRTKIQMPIYTFGLKIRYLEQGRFATKNQEPSYMKWLDSKPPRSVLYVSQGSFLSVTTPQMDEITSALKGSSVNYLLISRGEASPINDEGLMVPWCDQAKVLFHPSVGGFWTHCGWSSVKESIFAGVPMLTFPLHMDQFHNSKRVVDDWKIGWRVKMQGQIEYLVKKDEIIGLVKKFMDLEGVERREMMKRVNEVQDIYRQSVTKGGSTDVCLDAFTRDFLRKS